MSALFPLLLIATLGTLLIVRMSFKHADSPRTALVSPTVFALCGGLIGITVGMLSSEDKEGRVPLERGAPFLFCGAGLGAAIGIAAMRGYKRFSRVRSVVFVLTMVFLTGSIGGPAAWVVGLFVTTDSLEFVETNGTRMSWGIAIASSVGFAIGISHVFLRRGSAS